MGETYFDREAAHLRDDMSALRKDLAQHQAAMHTEMNQFHEHTHTCTALLREQIRDSVTNMERHWSEQMVQVRVEVGKLQIKTGFVAIIAGAITGVAGHLLGLGKK